MGITGQPFTSVCLGWTGEGKGLLRRGDEVYFLGAQDETLPEAALPLVQHPVANFDAIPDSYEVHLGAQVTVGVRKAQQVRVDPRDSFRFAYHLWLDAETALPLRLTMNHPQGAPVEVMQFQGLGGGRRAPRRPPLRFPLARPISIPLPRPFPRRLKRRAGPRPAGALAPSLGPSGLSAIGRDRRGACYASPRRRACDGHRLH